MPKIPQLVRAQRVDAMSYSWSPGLLYYLKDAGTCVRDPGLQALSLVTIVI